MKKQATTDYIKKYASELGYTVKTIDTNKAGEILSISNRNKKCIVDNGLFGYYPTNLRWQSSLYKDKITTQKFLEQKSFVTIPSQFFRVYIYSSCAQLSKKIHTKPQKYPLIVKPTNGLGGQNIIIATNRKKLDAAVKQFYTGGRDFMIQPLLEYDENRIFISHGEIMAIHSKNHKYIYSDGIHTIKQQLLHIPESHKSAVFIKKYLQKMNWTLATIPTKKTKIYYHIVKDNTREFIQTTNFLPKTKAWAKKLSTIIDGSVIGVDLFTPKGLEEPDAYIIIELNGNPSLRDYAQTYKNNELSKKIFARELEYYFKL